MVGSTFRRALSMALFAGAAIAMVAGPVPAGASGTRQNAPPSSVDVLHPVVSGTLVAKPVSGEGNIPSACVDRDQAAVQRAVTLRRGLVVCTNEGKLVLLQLSPTSRLFARDWSRVSVDQLHDGDHINAWGILRDNGLLLYPTRSIQDTNIPGRVGGGQPTVTGTLIARPISGETNLPLPCRDRDQAVAARAMSETRGLVICTEEGKLVLIQLSAGTRIHARFGGPISVDRFTDGDHINAWGTLQDNGFLLDPTTIVQDADVQESNVDSQDFVAQSGPRLTLYVLKSDAQSPVQGIVHAYQGGVTHIILCGGGSGTWQDLTVGKTLDISKSLFNRRLMTYIHTAEVRVVSCA
jgi:hypothetical protein